MSEAVKGRAWDNSRANFDRNLAVVIGIDQYQNGIARLNTAKPDAEKLAELLESVCKGVLSSLFLPTSAIIF